jgi:hypothetical protein
MVVLYGLERSEADRVEFKLNNNSESLVTSSQVVDEYKDKKLDNYKLVINVQKGIGNYYMVKDWDIKKKQ